MTAPDVFFLGRVDKLHRGGTLDPRFAEVLTAFELDDDEEQLADVIEADGRLRIRLGLPVALDRYLRACPDLGERPDALDAAIDVALRALAHTGHADEGSVQRLIASHPRLEAAIREAAALGNAMWSTRSVQDALLETDVGPLPRSFGAPVDDGEPRYELRELLGEGASGRVFLAVDRELSEADHAALVAIKVLGRSERDDDRRRGFIEEATKARRVTHPNVARVLDRGVSDDEEEFIVYELVDGGDLARWARRHEDRSDLRRIVTLMARIARGVHAAHMAGLVHCDLKPNNILLTSELEPKVADFGIAIRTGEPDDARGKGESTPIGNLAFISPEQYRMAPGALNIPTDVYALGGILFWAITRELPNGATAEAIRRNYDAGADRRAPPSLREHRPDVDGDLEAVCCARALAPEPEARHSSAASLADDLEAWLWSEPIPWRRPSLVRRARLWSRRQPALAIAAVILTVLSVASVVVLQRTLLERQYRRGFKANLHSFLVRLKQSAESGLEHEVLPQIWLGEWLFGPTVLTEGEARFELWDQRTDVIRNVLARSEAEGRDRELQALMWESALGFWLVRAGDHAESEPLLRANVAKWAALLPADDPWHDHPQAMLACATVNRLVASAVPDGPEMLAIASTLERLEISLDAAAPGRPLHLLVLDRLETLYGPQALDDPDRFVEIGARMKALDE